MASAPAILLAAPMTGSGKTVVTLGVMRALRRRGLRVGSFKVGPDYIDPGFHRVATGRPATNVDSWAMRVETAVSLVQRAGQDVDITIGEGVMGLFDGASGGHGSTADIASLFGIPVILVVDVARMGASAAALIEGFIKFREDVEIVGIVLNRVSREEHARLLIDACDERFSTPILGYIGQSGAMSLPSRHLGLVQAAERAGLDDKIDRMAETMERQLDIGRIVRLAAVPSVSALGHGARPLPPLGQRIAVAQDEAFGFAYDWVLDGWHQQGATISVFSPLADQPPAADADAVYLPGGYPELHAARLASAGRFLDGLRSAACSNVFVFGECGGYMVLGRTLTDPEGKIHRMAGLLPVDTSIAHPRLHLGYRQVTLSRSLPLGEEGASFRGHEFHYATETEHEGRPLFGVMDARNRPLGDQGCVQGRVGGSFVHLVDVVRPTTAAGPTPR